MSPAALTWILLIVLTVATLRHLPFINIDAAERLKWWLLDFQARIQEKHDDLKRKIDEIDRKNKP